MKYKPMIIENREALVNGEEKVFVIDAYGGYPNVLVLDEHRATRYVDYGSLTQEPVEETKQEREDAELQRERESCYRREI